MARRIKFRPTLREQQQQNLTAERHYASFAPAEKMAAAAERIEQLEAGIPQKRERAAPVAREAPVVKAISELLAVHPRVIWAARFNSGAASFEAASGRYQPIWFHRFLRAPEKMRMPDFFGLAYCKAEDDEHVDGSPFPIAIEAKAPGWTKPRDDREREQAAFLAMVRNAGGLALFATSADDVAKALR